MSARTDDTDSGASTSATAVISAQLKDAYNEATPAADAAANFVPDIAGPTPSTKR